jgi:hypothetical protein
LKDATTLLFFNSQSELLIFAEKVSVILSSISRPHLLTHWVAGLASQPFRSHGDFYEERRGTDGDTERDDDFCVLAVCARARDDCIESSICFTVAPWKI